MSSRVQNRIYKPIPSGKTEDPDEYKWDGLHPVHIGDKFKDGRYRIVHKLRHGSFSTVWLARDEQETRYVALKIVEAETSAEDGKDSRELKVLRDLAKSPLQHPGRQYVLTLLDDFWIEGPNGRSLCYVTGVAGNRVARPEGVTYKSLGWSQKITYQLFQGVSYLHACNIGHGDLYTSNILLQLKNFDSWSEDEIYACVGQPTREAVQRRDNGPLDDTVPRYLVQPCNMQGLEEQLSIPKILIIDFGQAFYHNESPDVLTPKLFMAPEILFPSPKSSALDQWQLGCTTFELCSGYSLFRMLFNAKMDVMKDVVAMLGKPPDTMWRNWEERELYFCDDGSSKPAVGRRIPARPYSLMERVGDIARADRKVNGEQIQQESAMQGDRLPNDDLAQLYDLLSKLLVYDARKRLPMNEALEHPFFSGLASHDARLAKA